MVPSGTEICYAPCLGMPSVISTVFLRQATQRFAEFGMMGVPQSAQSTLWIAGPGTNSMTFDGVFWVFLGYPGGGG